MENFSLELDFRDDSHSDRRHAPIARVRLVDPERDAGFISAACISISEFEAEIDRLCSELDAIRKKARRRFEAEKERFD